MALALGEARSLMSKAVRAGIVAMVKAAAGK
jgi:hypothetical protein